MSIRQQIELRVRAWYSGHTHPEYLDHNKFNEFRKQVRKEIMMDRLNAYQYYKNSGENPLKDRLGGMSMHRTFEFGGTLFIEMRDTYAGQRLIPVGKAYMVPLGTQNAFKTFFSPAHRLGLVNTLGEQVYVFEYADPKGTKIELETESNFVNALLRPALVVEFTTSN